MSSPDLIDERFDELVRELRGAEIGARPELRERVRAIAEREPEPPPSLGSRWLRPRRRAVLVLVPVAVALAAAIGFGVLSSGSGSQRQTAPHTLGEPALRKEVHGSKASLPPTALDQNQTFSTAQVPATLQPTAGRAQLYDVDMRLRVADLSQSTKRALSLTRSLGGYVRSVDYGSDQRAGTADLVVRIPIAHVQAAVVRFSALGKILDQHVSIKDIQPQLDKRFRQMQALRVEAASLRARLAGFGLTQSQRAALEAQLTRVESSLTALQHEQKLAQTSASFATLSLALETKRPAAAAPPSRFGRSMHEIGRVLVVELEVLLYVLLIGAPFAVLAAVLIYGRRSARRRANEQLLAR